MPQCDPQPREHRRERDDEQRLHKLEPARRVYESQDVAVGRALRKQVQVIPGASPYQMGTPLRSFFGRYTNIILACYYY